MSAKEPSWLADAAASIEAEARKAGLWSTRDRLESIEIAARAALDELQYEPPGDDAIGQRLDAARTIKDDCARLLAWYKENGR